jgi:hypothetical protein
MDADPSSLPPATNDCDESSIRSRRTATFLILRLILIIVGIWGAVFCDATAQVADGGTTSSLGVILLVVALLVAMFHSCRSLSAHYSASRHASHRVGDEVATWHTSREASPQSFRKRLAVYLHLPENEVLPPRPQPTSTMPFWSMVPLSQHTTVMKSVEYIRAILERIRHAVRGG